MSTKFILVFCLTGVAMGCGEVVQAVDAETGGDGAGNPDGSSSAADASPPDVVVIDAPPCPEPPCANGLACSEGSGCLSGFCECTDPGCTVRVCAAQECVCGYGSNGECTSMLTAGQADPEDCDGSNGCFDGACLLVDGVSCTGDRECGSGQCECTDASGTTRVCASSDCVCKYGAAGACSDPLASGSVDPEDCAGATRCYAGECKKLDGEACAANIECGSGECECANSSCTSRVCAATSCTCKYGTGGTCTNNLPNATDDPEDCVAASSSCYGGVCRAENLVLSTTCYDDRQCASGYCECRDAACSSRWCAAVSCTCRYNGSATATTCATTYINNRQQDPEDCYYQAQCGLSGFDTRYCACNGSGGCVITEPIFLP